MGTVLGVACNIDRGRPVVRGVLLGDDDAATGTFSYGTRRNDDWALQLRSLETTLRTELERRTIEAVVVRLRDYFKRQSVDTGVVRRCQAEGVIMAVARRTCEKVEALNGREIGTTAGTSKDSVWQEAGGLVEADLIDAAAAALAARHLV